MIRAFEKKEEFEAQSTEILNEQVQCQSMLNNVNFYFQIRLVSLSNLLVLSIGLLIILQRGFMSAIYLALVF